MKNATKVTVVALAVAGALVGGNVISKNMYVDKSNEMIYSFNEKEKANKVSGVPMLSVERTVDKTHPFSNKLTEVLTINISGDSGTEKVVLTNDVSVIPFVGADIVSKFENEGVIAEIRKEMSFDEDISTNIRIMGEPVVSFDANFNNLKSTSVTEQETGVLFKASNLKINGNIDLGKFKEGNIIADNANGLQNLGITLNDLDIYAKNESLSVDFDKLELVSKLRSDSANDVSDKSTTTFKLVKPTFSITNPETGKPIETAKIDSIFLESGYEFDFKQGKTDLYVSTNVSGINMPDDSWINYGIEGGKTYNSEASFKINGVESESLAAFAEIASTGNLIMMYAGLEPIVTEIVNGGLSFELSKELERIDDKKQLLDVDAALTIPENKLSSQSFAELMPLVTADATGFVDTDTSKKFRSREHRSAIGGLIAGGFLVDGGDKLTLDFKLAEGKVYAHGVEK